jgi:hypothetical protein
MRPTHPGHEECPCDLIWDRAGLAIASNPAGHELRVGEGGEWEADRLFSLALQSALMSSFVERAERAGIHLLGYLSSGNLRPAAAGDRDRELVLAPCVVVEAESEREAAWSILHQAAADSHLCRLLGEALVLTPHIVATSLGPG